MDFDLTNGRPGDALLYDTPGDFIDLIITRTGPAAHIEILKGANANGFTSVASRNGMGVSEYPFRSAGLLAVLRPVGGFDLTMGFTWFESVRGEKYDLKGVSEDFLAWKDREAPNELFCSAFGALFYQNCGLPMFNRSWPKGLVTPSDFLKTPRLDWIWTDFSL
jgi:hypothetical protein